MNANEIIPYGKNAKKHPEKQIREIMKAIAAFGFNQPLVLSKSNEIVVGHGRYEAALRLGFEEVRIGVSRAGKGEKFIPAIRVEDLSDEEVRLYRITDNKLNESPWDMDLLIEDLKELELGGMDISLTGFSVDIINDASEDDFDAEEAYRKIKEPKSKRGDVYRLGSHRLMCGDSKNVEDFAKLFREEKARLVFTDPPYNVDYHSPAGISYHSKKFGGSGGKIFNDNLSDDDCVDFYTKTLKNIHQFTKGDACVYWWFASKNQHLNMEAFRASGWRMAQIVIWLKNSMVLSRGQDYHRCYEPCMFGWKEKQSHYSIKSIKNYKDAFHLEVDDFSELLDVWYERRDNTNKYVHPTQKPVRLALRAIKKNSDPNDIVADVFGGSGSTMIACEQMRRRCFSMELDPKYCDVIVARWEKFTGEKSETI